LGWMVRSTNRVNKITKSVRLVSSLFLIRFGEQFKMDFERPEAITESICLDRNWQIRSFQDFQTSTWFECKAYDEKHVHPGISTFRETSIDPIVKSIWITSTWSWIWFHWKWWTWLALSIPIERSTFENTICSWWNPQFQKTFGQPIARRELQCSFQP
jgi:hypothetical protein